MSAILEAAHKKAQQVKAAVTGRWLVIFALVVVSFTVSFIAYQQIELTKILAAPDWCARAIKAEQLAEGRQTTSCASLLFKQVSAIAMNSHIYAGTMALALLVLVVIVVAGGQLAFSANKTGVTGNIGKAPPTPAEAAAATASAATDQAEQIAAMPGADVSPGAQP